MYETFDFLTFWNMILDFFDFFKRKLTSSYDTSRTLLIPEICCLIVCIIRLCRNMKIDIWTVLLGEHEHTRISHKNSIRLNLCKFSKVLCCAFEIIIMSENIRCDINFHTMLMSKANTFNHIFF